MGRKVRVNELRKEIDRLNNIYSEIENRAMAAKYSMNGLQNTPLLERLESCFNSQQAEISKLRAESSELYDITRQYVSLQNKLIDKSAEMEALKNQEPRCILVDTPLVGEPRIKWLKTMPKRADLPMNLYTSSRCPE